MKKLAILTVCAIGLAGCAGREARPVAISEDYDANLSCEQLHAEIRGNEQKALQLAGEADSAKAANIAVGAVGVLLFWPALFALDLTDTQTQEISALRARNTHMATLADVHGCNNPHPTTAAKSATPAATSAAPAQPTPPATVAAPLAHWVGQGERDGCGKPYAADITVQGQSAKGRIERDGIAYIVNAKL